MKIKKILTASCTISILIILLYTLINAILGFYSGYHNLDTAQNFLQLGYTQDINVNGELVNLKDYYLIGLNQMQNNFYWICFDVILGVLLGYFIRGVKNA